ncbi:ABC transporter ATP-binding protein [Candidatus Woesearchaeota archaeon]|nr:ABC transporter ATP-binding protein [Candidatus Woesearchaeota archaeon]
MDAIILENVSKTFKIPHDYKAGIKSYLLGFFNLTHCYERFHALKNINLRVRQGEFLGIIGPNGSGKSTLLKIIANVIQPTTGRVLVHGKISPFLELGVGFQGELTVKENVYLYGVLLGIQQKEIARRFDSIIHFAELERFIDTKLKNLSSGMLARLGFSIAIQVDADILLVDEVLAVGDEAFQEKCYSIFRKFKREGKTILLVSHDKSLIRKFADRTIRLHHEK